MTRPEHPDASTGDDDPEASAPLERGKTTISDRAVARIVAKVADEIEDTGGLARTVLGVPVPGRRPAHTDVRVDAGIVTVRMALSVAYPRPVRTVAHRVRESVRGRVEDLTGLTVRQVDIEVAELRHPVVERTVS
ncbi:Asp23/Gls24 family envelope stress response protein [Actinomadura macra]|uniref:Asp23/Gls24 family envelope stress response protein n=1 Tax=Actinomadura macra TaxID=46164 RepID=UPI000832D068|nr:Asp23/Gls24 family envelope stress response protein [Actinomadura macra]